MSKKYVFLSFINVIDDNHFTADKVLGWREHLLDCYEVILNKMLAKIDNSSPIEIYVDASLLDEVVADAVIGMKKITESSNNEVEDPNAFKIAAYLTYWWLRHKPVCVHYPSFYRLENVVATVSQKLCEKEAKEVNKTLAWELKHLNEMVAVEIAMTYIFKFDIPPICTDEECENIKTRDRNSFSFENFDEMQEVILEKLLYYFSYRAIAPKMIEHLLEGYTFHPAWQLTGDQWGSEEKKDKL